MQTKFGKVFILGMVLYFLILCTGISSADELDIEYVGLINVTNNDFTVSGNYAYLADGSNGLSIVDISDPSSPKLTGFYSSENGYITEVATSGIFAYLAVINDEKCNLVVLDVKNSSSPTAIGISEISNLDYAHDWVGDIEVSGNYVYITINYRDEYGTTPDGGDGFLYIVDISIPSSPEVVSSYETHDVIRNIVVYENYIYLANNLNGVSIYEFDPYPYSLRLVGVYDVGGMYDRARVKEVTVLGNYAYLSYSENVQLGNNYADYYDDSGFVILNVEDPSSTTLVGTYSDPWNGWDFLVFNNCLYFVYNGGGIYSMDGTNVSSLTLVSNYGLSFFVTSGNYIYSSSDGVIPSAGVNIFKINSPNNDKAPELVYIGNKTVNETESLRFTVSATDDDGDAINYSAMNLLIGANLNSTTGLFSWTPGVGTRGVYNITFIATANSKTDSEKVYITVNSVDHAPILASIGNKSLNVNELLSFMISATDADGDAINYSATGLPSGATFNPVTATFSWTPNYEQVNAIFNVTFTATANGKNDSESIKITVLAGDWNHWDDPSSENGEKIALSELQAAIYDWRYGITLPNGEKVDIARLQGLIYQWRFG